MKCFRCVLPVASCKALCSVLHPLQLQFCPFVIQTMQHQRSVTPIALTCNVRHQSSLGRLLNEKDDLFLNAVQELSLTEVANIIRNSNSYNNEDATAAKANHKTNNNVSRTNCTTENNDHAHSMELQEKQAKWLYEGMCAVNAILRVHYQSAIEVQESTTNSNSKGKTAVVRDVSHDVTQDELNEAKYVCDLIQRYICEQRNNNASTMLNEITHMTREVDECEALLRWFDAAKEYINEEYEEADY